MADARGPGRRRPVRRRRGAKLAYRTASRPKKEKCGESLRTREDLVENVQRKNVTEVDETSGFDKIDSPRIGSQKTTARAIELVE